MLERVCSDHKSFIKEAIGLESRQFKPSRNEFVEVIKREADSMFRDKESYTLHEFIGFRRELMKELYTYEFRTFQRDEQHIDGVDFARSIIKYAQNNQKRKFLRRIHQIEGDIEAHKIKEIEYINFHFMLQVNYKSFERLLEKKGALSREDMKSLLGQEVKVTDGEVDVFFKLLDTDSTDETR